MAHSVLSSVCWCKCKMLLLKAVELLQIHPGAAEIRAQPSAGLLEGAGAGAWSCCGCFGRMLTEAWCLTSLRQNQL